MVWHWINGKCYYFTPEDVMKSWMNSSGHKKNILKTSFGRIGVGCAKINGTYYWVQIFTN